MVLMTRDWKPKRNTPWTLGLPLLLALAALQLTSVPEHIDYWLYDAMATTLPAKAADNVAIVAIDESSLSSLGRWPWPRTTHAELIKKLDKAGAKTIVFDVLFTEPSTADAELATAIAAHGNVILPVHLALPSTGKRISEQRPTPTLREAAANLGHAHVEFDSDGLARGLYLYSGLGNNLWPSLGLAAASSSNSQNDHTRKLSEPAAVYINVSENYVAVPLAGKTGTIPTYSYQHILRTDDTTPSLAGKTVFVGATAAGLGDNLPTPFSAHASAMPGVEFHANIYSAITHGTLITLAGPMAGLLLALAVITLLSTTMPLVRPVLTLAICGATIAVLLASFVVLKQFSHLWLPVSSALLMPCIAFPLWSARRLAMTQQFLRLQLDQLDNIPNINLPDVTLRQPQQILEYLSLLLSPQGWYLSQNGRVLTSHNLSTADVPLHTAPDLWAHYDNQSWILLERGGHRYELGLALTNDLNCVASQRYLQRLKLWDITEGPLKPDSRESISAEIERVRLATERMSSMQQFIHRSFERMPDGVIVTDVLGIIQFTNGHIEKWFNEPHLSLTGMPLVRLLQGHDPRDTPPWWETVSETLTLGQSRTVDLHIRGKDYLIHFAPFSPKGPVQQGLIANISDISELREQQRQHREAIDFISHDVRSPLVSQLALIEHIKRSPGSIQPEQLEQLGRLARRSYQLAEEFVQLARAEQLTETRFYECELLAIAENARDSVVEQATEKGIALSLQGTEDLWLKGNAELLERAVINLLTNAVQYSVASTTVTIQVFRAGHQACLTVSDEGTGIAESELPFLFDRYRRQKSSEMSGNYGAGLGLSFVNVVIEKHRGEIGVTTELGEGSVFTIKLPIADLPPA